MQGLVQHLAQVERNWFRRVLAGEDIGPIQPPRARSGGHDGGFEVHEGHTLTDALATPATVAMRTCCASGSTARPGCEHGGPGGFVQGIPRKRGYLGRHVQQSGGSAVTLASGVIQYGGGGVAILTASLVIAVIAATVAIEKRRNLFVWLIGSFAGSFVIITAVADLATR